MDLSNTVQIISNIGFPITCVLFLGWFIYQATNKIMDNQREREEKLYQMIGQQSEQMKEQQRINADFVTVLGKLRDDVNDIKDVLQDMEKE